MTMPRIDESAPPRRHEVTIDIDRGRELAAIGVRRAAAFMGLGLAATSGEPEYSVSLSGLLSLRFLPDPMSDELALKIRDEFQTWVIGNALREIDLHFNLFLDEVWATIQFAALHGKSVKSDYKLKSISAETNAANKLERVLEALGQANADVNNLRSLSNFRNCLTHSAGFVQPRHAHSDGQMLVSWRGLDFVLKEGDHQRILNEEHEPVQIGDGGGEVLVIVAERQRTFAVGAQVVLAPQELAEICWFFEQEATFVQVQLVDFLKGAGLPFKEVASPAMPALPETHGEI